jgi:hypothetical protein
MWFIYRRSPDSSAAFRGALAEPPYFEGWYLKLVDATCKHRVALIPGVAMPAVGKREAFVQVLDGTSGKSAYLPFPQAAFRADTRAFDVSIHAQRFSRSGVAVDLRSGALRVAGSVRFGPLAPWPHRRRSPGAMGPFAYAPNMECYHEVVSFGHSLEGSLELGDTTVDFTGGRGYIEKDWGRSFPSDYVWIHSNHFRDRSGALLGPHTSLLLSLARIPWMSRAFRGILCGFMIEGRLVRIATYTGARLERLTVTDRACEVVIRDPLHTLELTVARATATMLTLPTAGAMVGHVAETLDAQADVCVTGRGWRRTERFEATAECVGLELHGDLSRLQSSALWI